MRRPCVRTLLVAVVLACTWSAPCANAWGSTPRSALDLHATSYTIDLLPPMPTPRLAPTPTPPAHAQRPRLLHEQNPDVFLVIGVKSRALRGFDERQAIRETWGARAATMPLGVRVVFVGCEPDFSPLQEDAQRDAALAIAREKATHADFLTQELQCHDSFFTLVDKTVAFLDYAAAAFPTLAFAMVVDDDVFVRLDRLVALLRSDAIPKTRFYGGNVAEIKHLTPSAPIRSPEGRYYLPTDVYPMASLPPFVAGAQYILSRDIVHFVARNRRDLRGLRGLDDVTIALWMLALQVHPFFLASFQILRTWNCTENLISYADLSPSAIRTLHANVAHGRPMCDGHGHDLWLRDYRTILFEEYSDPSDYEDKRDVSLKWDLELDPRSGRLRVLTAVTVARQRVELLYFPASAPYHAAFCNRVLPLLETKLSILVGTNFCRHNRGQLLRFLRGHDESMPAMHALLAVARHNLERDLADDTAGKPQREAALAGVVANGSRFVHVLVECLMVALFPDKHVAVMDESGDFRASTPNVVVLVASSATRRADFHKYLGRYDHAETRIWVVSADGRRVDTPEDERITVISSERSREPSWRRQLCLPLVSAAFGASIRHTPLQLLRPASSIGTQPRAFCGFSSDRCDSPSALEQELVGLLRDVESVEKLGGCPPHGDESEPLHQPRTAFDDTVGRYKSFKFVVVVEDTVATPGLIGERIAMAFLAGSVPIYSGHSPTASALFNPRAFVDCARFASLRGCANHVLLVHRTPSLYDAMRSEPPVANTTAFYEAFSWHPQVAAMAPQHHGRSTVAQRLAALMRVH